VNRTKKTTKIQTQDIKNHEFVCSFKFLNHERILVSKLSISFCTKQSQAPWFLLLSHGCSTLKPGRSGTHRTGCPRPGGDLQGEAQWMRGQAAGDTNLVNLVRFDGTASMVRAWEW
jgi:hypothetical protein